MNCKDVARALSEESPWSFQAQDHLRICNRCQELVRLLNSSVPVDPPSPATLRQMAEGMASNLRPVRPVAPAPYFFGAFVGVFVSIVALSVYRLGAFAIAVMTPLQTAAILSAWQSARVCWLIPWYIRWYLAAATEFLRDCYPLPS